MKADKEGNPATNPGHEACQPCVALYPVPEVLDLKVSKDRSLSCGTS